MTVSTSPQIAKAKTAPKRALPKRHARAAVLEQEPQPHRWTRADYYKMGELGLLPEKNVELIEGEIIEMSPIHSPHATAVTLLNEVLREVFSKGWVIREEKPLSLGTNSDPQPDLAVVAGKVRDYAQAHPDTAALVIEVAESTLSYDRKRKASLYAKAGIQDYWIINLVNQQVEVHRRPIADKDAPSGFSYGELSIFKDGDKVAPLAKPKAKIAVADLLP
jgi:Uma2 family endonuclease